MSAHKPLFRKRLETKNNTHLNRSRKIVLMTEKETNMK